LIAVSDLEELDQEPQNKTVDKIGDNKPSLVKQPMNRMIIIQSLKAIFKTFGDR